MALFGKYHRVLQTHLPISERGKCFTTVGVYEPQESSNYVFTSNKLVEKSWGGNSDHLPKIFGNFPSYNVGDGPADVKLLLCYDVYNPHLARVLADEHRKFIEKTADRTHMELLYPEIVKESYSKHFIEHDIQFRPAGFPKKKRLIDPQFNIIILKTSFFVVDIISTLKQKKFLNPNTHIIICQIL
jgi:hypothetical protein